MMECTSFLIFLHLGYLLFKVNAPATSQTSRSGPRREHPHSESSSIRDLAKTSNYIYVDNHRTLIPVMNLQGGSKFKLGEPKHFTYEGIRYDVCKDVESIEELRRHVFRPTDILLASYPKSGTIWMTAMVRLLFSDGREMEHHSFSFLPDRIGEDTVLQHALRTQPPHFFATHLPFGLLEESFQKCLPKVINIIRNPFDQLVSYYHYHKIRKPFGLYTGSWNEFYEDFYKKDLLFYGNHLDHVAEWWEAQKEHKDGILYVKYEDMVRNPRDVLNQVASFLGKELSEDVMESILQKSSFQSMEKNPNINYTGDPGFDLSASKFMRKGTVGDWKNYFNEEQMREVEQEYEQKVKSLGLFLEREI